MTSCDMVCMLCKKALDALKGDDLPRATNIMVKAHDLCITGECTDPKLCRGVDLALGELIEGDIISAGKFLKDLVMYCKK